MPVFLQIVKGESPTGSGLQLMPLMLGLLATSIGSGRVISRLRPVQGVPDRRHLDHDCRPLPALAVGVGSSTWVASGYMLVLGVGLGMVMQVLVLAVQNAVEYRFMGVATSGSLLFRQIGGSIGVSLFGAIFANRLLESRRASAPA